MAENRATKKQHELLMYIDEFIKTNGYGPSYREVMRALDYKSVSTVAVHVNGLIAQGLLLKRDNSARSLEVVEDKQIGEEKQEPHVDWLNKEIKMRMGQESEESKRQARVLQEALAILQSSPRK